MCFSAVEKEALAAVCAVRVVRPFLEKSQFVLRSGQRRFAWAFKEKQDEYAR